MSYWNANVFGTDQYSQIRLTGVIGGDFTGALVRGSASPSQSYIIAIKSDGAYLYAFVSPNFFELMHDVTGWATGDVVRLEVRTVAGSTARLTVYRNGSQLFTYDDAAHFIAGGQPGIGLHAATAIALDDWEGGDLQCATPTPTPTPTGTPTPTPIETPTPTPAATPTATATPINISGTVSYCPNSNPVPNVTLTLTGSASGSTLSNGSGNYTLSSLDPGGTYTVTPTKTALLPSATGINTVDVVAVQRHFLSLGTPLSGCRLTAADVNGVGGVNTVDVIAIQRFFLGFGTGIANTGKYKFTPVNRAYTGVITDQTGQNYDTLIFGDVAPPFAE